VHELAQSSRDYSPSRLGQICRIKKKFDGSGWPRPGSDRSGPGTNSQSPGGVGRFFFWPVGCVLSVPSQPDPPLDLPPFFDVIIDFVFDLAVICEFLDETRTWQS
jgi:hypothetical protein